MTQLLTQAFRSLVRHSLVFGIICVSLPALAQSPAAKLLEQIATQLPAEDLGLISKNELTRRSDEAQARIESLESTLNEIQSKPGEEWLTKSYKTELAQLKYLRFVNDRRIQLLKHHLNSQPHLATVDDELKLLQDRIVSASRHITFLEVEKLRTASDAQAARVAKIKAELGSGEGSRTSAQSQLSEQQHARRRLKESRSSVTQPLEKRKLDRQMVTLELSLTINKAVISNLEIEEQNRKHDLAIAERRHEMLKDLLATMPSELPFAEEDLEKKLGHLEQEQIALQEQMANTSETFREMETQVDALVSSGELDPGERMSVLGTFEQLRDIFRLRIHYLNATLTETFELQGCWTTRYELRHGPMVDDVIDRQHDAFESLLGRLKSGRELVRMQLNEARSNQASLILPNKPTSEAEDSVSQLRTIHQRGLDELFNVGNRRLVHIESALQLLGRVKTEMARKASADGQPSSWLAFKSSVSDLWHRELFAVDDRPITPGKLMIACLMLFAGLFFSRRASKVLSEWIFKKFGVHEGSSQALQSILFYCLCLVLGFFTLEWLNIPLAIFAFLGGAAAIAIGFGSQTLLNNFISGLIMMGERPVRVGDLIEVDGVKGTVTRIGARSTRMHTAENLEIIVPNSKFMEQRLTNWTLSSTITRTKINVGVAYGTPVDKLLELFESAVEDCPEANANPKPVVLFSDFGNDALQFEIYFWVNMKRPMELQKAESSLRIRLDKALRDNGISVAFPQRDVHLDVTSPIKIALAGSGDSVRPSSRKNEDRNAA